ncbi:DUF333 domain-containing protein [Pseudomonas sp. ANT_H14]|nr:DUF333 domain-containing protein [Pseudomonas sp. ANT_H4]KAA0947179.1 DUF333 domain-containing protein [Pseudomonas sp. ANT_H14]
MGNSEADNKNPASVNCAGLGGTYAITSTHEVRQCSFPP